MEHSKESFEYVARLHEVMNETGCNGWVALRQVEEEFKDRIREMVEKNQEEG